MEKLIERQKIENRFKEYTKDYDLADPKIRLKYDHTFRVAALCEQIAQSIHLSEHVRSHGLWECCMTSAVLSRSADMGHFRMTSP